MPWTTRPHVEKISFECSLNRVFRNERWFAPFPQPMTQGRPFYCSIGGKMVSTFVINLKLNWIVWFVPIRQSTIWPIREPIKKVLREGNHRRPVAGRWRCWLTMSLPYIISTRSNWSPCKLRVVCTITGQEELGKDGKGYELYFIKLISVATANWEDLATQALGASHL